MATTEQPTHGAYGDTHMSVTIGEHAVTSCWGNARWCDTCKEWMYPTSVVSLVVGAVCCPRCHRSWDALAALNAE